MDFLPDLNPSRIVGREQLTRGEVSVSGHERNRLFWSRQGQQFTDLSGVSGLDHVGDSRVFALFDYDRDGWQDVALINANAPLLQIFRNRIGDIPTAPARRHVVALRLVGGNWSPEPVVGWSARDGYGASVVIGLEELTLHREQRAGDGFAAQNSATMIVGVGARDEIASVTVRWPSGRVQETVRVPAGTLLTVYEDVTQSPTGEAFVAEPYVGR